MARLRFLTAGESHGPALTVIVEGLPAGLPLTADYVNAHLARRQKGYGRGGRMDIEQDRVAFLSGIRHGKTIGSPLALTIENRDWKNWKTVMATESFPGAGDERRVTTPRPGHADLPGGMKYDTKDLRDILERASARETAARVAAGAVFRRFLEHLGVSVIGWVEEIGGVQGSVPARIDDETTRVIEDSVFRSPDPGSEESFRARVDAAAAAGDTVGGVFAIRAAGLVPGLGSHVQWDRRLDGQLAAALMSIPGVRGVEIGLGFRGVHLGGVEYQDQIEPAAADAGHPWRSRRKSNRAGGLEGGMTNGEMLMLRAAMKPIPTTGKPLASVDVTTGREAPSHHERSDLCAVPAASVVGEAMTAFVLAAAYLDKFAGDTLKDVLEAFESYRSRLSSY